ncbi:hypothetical protein LCGC14_0719620 [marine sediment metagenome]|uniref:RNA polymerase sigma-70 factor n=2 Tax=root TaxID=1 RepID=A0A831QM57_9FLAO|nr:RNA polymerase sigma-70 factor [Pricia sp.]HEA19523.1 RNA polymerase sigma-70 factor [Pricia antarctica]
MNFENETFLIGQLKKGREEAYVFLLEKYQRRLYAYALTLIKDRALAKDITQNVFLRTWQFREKLKSGYSLQSFLFTSIYNEFVNTYRKNKSTLLVENEYFKSLATLVDSVDDKETQRLISFVKTEVDLLPPKCRQIFTLSKSEGLTNPEIAEYLNISIKAVEAQISKAFKILRTKLGQKFEVILFLLFGTGSKRMSKS